MYEPNASSISAYYISEQPNSQKAAIGEKMLRICYQVLEYLFQLLGALLTRALLVVIVVSLTLLAALFLIGAVIFGRKKSFGIKQKQSVPFCKQNSEGATSLLFIFLVLGGMHISSLFLGLRKKETLSQSKGTPIQEDQGTDMAYL